jgi:hypothetical protein
MENGTAVRFSFTGRDSWVIAYDDSIFREVGEEVLL